MVTHQDIYNEIELHADNGVPPHALPHLVAELLEVPIQTVKRVWKQWLEDAGWN
jgi:hypothetical protein